MRLRMGAQIELQAHALQLLVALVIVAQAPLAHAQPPNVNGLCVEQVSTLPGLYMQEHPAGGLLAVATQDGLIRLITRPAVQSNQRASIVSTFLDLSARVKNSGEQGLLSFAFHPRFLRNGRFFVSYICDGQRTPDCQAKCECANGKGCLTAGISPMDCAAFTVVSEYSAGPNPSAAKALQPREVKRWFNFGRPYNNHNGGQIWFGSDGFFYLASGDGGSQNDPFDNSQNGRTHFGKIFRVNVNVPARQRFGIPRTNPFRRKPNWLPEIWAYGLRNAWRCSEDPVTKKLFCGDVGGNKAEEVDVVVRAGNYGWPYLEGTQTLKGLPNPRPRVIAPTFEYLHTRGGKGECVIGGHVYRAKRNTCLQGMYVYGDEFGAVYVGRVYPQNRAATKQVRLAVGLGPNFAGVDYLYSWGVDRANELYRLSSSGVYRVINGSRCNFRC